MTAFVSIPRGASSDASSLLSTNSSECSLSSSPPKAQRRPPSPMRLTSVGVEPKELVGRVLIRMRRSMNHPALTLDFADNTTFQILVDGYSPTHRGVPKTLETNPFLDSVVKSSNGELPVELTIVDCALITMTDKAFERKEKDGKCWEEHWDQNHVAVALKFAEDKTWHCIWAVMSEEEKDCCVFRSYEDVYIEPLHRSSRKRAMRSRTRSPVKKSRAYPS